MKSVTYFSEETKLAAFVFGELSIESLEEGPHVGCCSYRAGYGICSIGEANANWLINVDHVRIAIETVWIQRRSGRSIIKLAWPILLEQPDHR